ncbi:MAG: Do family serine endopeptidase [Acidobacteriaceae bacterium]|nr:Do family serine endopeptidase [Acidobacteriaceae bacterium]MBV9499418.1 Do family serine endopeptidase [Acidobacteriaceae bacterium]
MSNVVQFRRSTAILTLVAASIGGGLIAAFAVSHNSAPVPVLARADTNPSSAVRAETISTSFADIVEKASPAVVEISSTRIIKASQQQGNNPLLSDPFFRQFFGGNGGPMGHPRDQREEGLGSGILVSPNGYILTNNHVVEKANSLKVSLSDGRDFSGKVIGADPQTDVAVIKINADNLPTLPFANSDAARVGDLCFAIGNPFGQEHTVTMGIVSAKNRTLERNTYIQNFIQTDASINPGNSGGALINAKGQLIGMNTMILTGGTAFGGEGGNVGIGFAVPSNLAKQVMDQLMKNGKVSRGYIGVNLENLTPELGQHFGVPSGKGALVSTVVPGGPGDKAGLKSGDVVTAIDGKKIENYDELTMDVISHEPGSTVTLDVVRNGQPMTVKVTLGQRPGGVNWGQRNGNNPGNDNDQNDNGNSGNASARGITVEPLTPDLAQQIGVPANTKGVVVDSVDADSPAAESQYIQQGTVITAINRHPVTSVQEFKQLINEANGKAVLVTVNDGGNTFFTVIQPK